MYLLLVRCLCSGHDILVIKIPRSTLFSLQIVCWYFVQFYDFSHSIFILNILCRYTKCTFLLRFVSFYGHLSFYQKLTRGRPSCFCPPIIRSGLGYTVIENIYDKHFLRCCCCYAPLKSKRVFVIPIIMFGTMCELVFTTKNEEINAN